MRIVVGAIAVVVGLGLTAPAAHAGTGGCEEAAAAFQANHPTEYADAGSPPIVCEPVRNGALGGLYDWQYVHVYPAHGSAAPADYYREVVAHEVGHAYGRYRLDRDQYARIRGFTLTPDAPITEDYAEVFAFALGEWSAIGSPPPFAFQTEAGPPTFAEIEELACLGMLPGCEWTWPL